jgi:hypothetical protein
MWIFFFLCDIYLSMHPITAPGRAFLQQNPHGVAQVNAAASDNARLVYQPQRAATTAVFSQIPPFSAIGYRASPPYIAS